MSTSIVTVNRGAQGPPTRAETERIVFFEDFNGVAQSSFTVADWTLGGGAMTNADGSDVSTMIGAMITPELEKNDEISFVVKAKLSAHNGDSEFECGFGDAAGSAAGLSHSFAIALASGLTPAQDVVTCYLDDNNGTRSEVAVTLSQTALGEGWTSAANFEFGGTLKRIENKYHAKFYVNGVLVATLVDDVPVPITGHFDDNAMGLFVTQPTSTALAEVDWVYAEVPRS